MDECVAVLDELVRLAAQERVDAVLVAGDSFEQRVPSPDAQELFFATLIGLHEAGAQVVIIPGNHDSPALFRAFAPLLSRVGVRVVHEVKPPGQGGQVLVPSRDGRTSTVVACVPFVPERRFGDAAALFEASENWPQAYSAGMSELLRAMTANFKPENVNVLMAHLFTDGATLGGGEREITIGADFAISPSRLPPTASYVALGHVHLAQTVKGSAAPARYAGSLLQLDFGETDQVKSVFVVETEPGAPAKVRQVPLAAGRKLVSIRGRIEDLIALAQPTGDAYLRVFVQTDGPVPGMGDRVREMLPNAVAVFLEYDRGEAEEASVPVLSLQPRDQFLAYYRKAHLAEPHASLVTAFEEVLELERGSL